MSVQANWPIGVFDSGVGGLTVLNALRQRLPQENLLYLGDTARVPYGTKSSLSVTRYAEQAVACLLRNNVKMIVVACNTASAVAIEPLRALYPNLPIVGVVEPGAEASCDASRTGHIGVIATESTVNNAAYQAAILKRNPDASIVAQACSLFVALAEEGWHDGELVDQIVTQCLAPLKQDQHARIDTLVLGCTHFPALQGSIGRVMGDKVTLVDSADTTARYVAKQLQEHQLANLMKCSGEVNFMVTDGPERFVRVANHFFSEAIDLARVQVVDIQHLEPAEG
ncbi:glutamate racemase [Pontibacter sp. JAM-7]|uniref:glutamate racemase n=1 Tax=Pontibacter sp. JAM-7 TaxID=3366581 RepID=UPI003AF5D910